MSKAQRKRVPEIVEEDPGQEDCDQTFDASYVEEELRDIQTEG